MEISGWSNEKMNVRSGNDLGRNFRSEKNMYIVEKIGNLIVITVSERIKNNDLENIKNHLKRLSEVAKTDTVVTFHLRGEKNLKKRNLNKDVERKINKILEFCDVSGLRVYSYKYR